MNYYGVRIVILCVTEGGIPEEGYTQDIQVYVVDAKDDNEAFSKALEIGRKEEHSYKNKYGEEVQWLFKEVEAITYIGENIEGKEVSSRMEGFYPELPIGIETKFDPEKSDPTISSNESAL